MNKKYAGLLGIGLMVVWGAALLPLMDHINDGSFIIKIASILLAAFISITMTGVMVYTNELETKNANQKERLDQFESAYEEQKREIAFLEKRLKNASGKAY